MNTWKEYTEYVKSFDDQSSRDIEEAEVVAKLISITIRRRKELGLSQRDVAMLCGLSQSSIARIESCQSVPSLETMARIVNRLNMQLSLSVNETAIRSSRPLGYQWKSTNCSEYDRKRINYATAY